jgi:hypothetical protein
MSEPPSPASEPFRVVTKNRPLRWRAVSEDGRSSPSWKLWIYGNDVYLCQRSLGGDLKISLHESGTFQTSLINGDKATEWLGPNRSRHLDRWERMPEFFIGWTRLIEVIHPYPELGQFEELDIQKVDHVALPVPLGMALHMVVLLSRPVDVMTKIEFENCVHVAQIELSGQVAHVMGILQPWGATERAIAENARSRPMGVHPRSIVPPNASVDPTAPQSRLLTSGLHVDGHRYFLDLAASSPYKPRT